MKYVSGMYVLLYGREGGIMKVEDMKVEDMKGMTIGCYSERVDFEEIVKECV